MNTRKPDFSDVRGGSTSQPGFGASTGGAPQGAPDFSDVRSGSSSVPEDGGRGAGRTYTVERGDTLSEIAQRLYGRASRWHAIFDANRDQLDDPDRIEPGQVLKIPDLPHDDAR